MKFKVGDRIQEKNPNGDITIRDSKPVKVEYGKIYKVNDNYRYSVNWFDDVNKYISSQELIEDDIEIDIKYYRSETVKTLLK